MALKLPAMIIRLTLAATVAATLSACSSVPAPSAQVLDRGNAQVAQRGASQSESGNSTRTVVPRAYLELDDLADNAPDVYTVVRGDTLWDISDRFLKEPWLWPKIWDYNPQVHNPHLIYPGDILALDYVNGEPTLTLTRNGKTVPRLSASGEPALGAANPVELDANGKPVASSASRTRLSPRIREESLDESIPTIPAASIQQFLVHPKVVTASDINAAPYIVANEQDSLISAVGNRIYVRGQLNRNQTSYGIYRSSAELIDPVNGALLGQEVKHVGDAKLLNIGDPSTLTITNNNLEAAVGDILIPTGGQTISHTFTTRLPELQGEARIISLSNAIAQTGRNQVVVLNIGSDSNIREGDVLAIESRGREIIDAKGRHNYEYVTLPNIRTGVLMVFRTFDRVSYALVMESTNPVKVNDIVTGI